jgi:hypothetical protein
MALSYQMAKLYGDSLTDYVWIKNTVDSQETINTTLANTFQPSWDANTELLAPFTSNINGGNSSSISTDVINWWIYKQKMDDTTLTFVAKVPATQNTLIDYNVLNNTEYLYTIFAETATTLSAPIQASAYTTASWWNWSLIGLVETSTNKLYYADSDNIWLFDTNLTSGEQTQNLATYTYDNFTQFPKVSQGQRNYITGQIDCYISNYSKAVGGYVDTVEMQNNFRTFINNGEIKLLRDRKGNGYLVQTNAGSSSYVDDSAEQIIKVTLQYVQIGTLDNINVIERY